MIIVGELRDVHELRREQSFADRDRFFDAQRRELLPTLGLGLSLECRTILDHEISVGRSRWLR